MKEAQDDLVAFGMLVSLPTEFPQKQKELVSQMSTKRSEVLISPLKRNMKRSCLIIRCIVDTIHQNRCSCVVSKNFCRGIEIGANLQVNDVP